MPHVRSLRSRVVRRSRAVHLNFCAPTKLRLPLDRLVPYVAPFPRDRILLECLGALPETDLGGDGERNWGDEGLILEEKERDCFDWSQADVSVGTELPEREGRSKEEKERDCLDWSQADVSVGTELPEREGRSKEETKDVGVQTLSSSCMAVCVSVQTEPTRKRRKRRKNTSRGYLRKQVIRNDGSRMFRDVPICNLDPDRDVQMMFRDDPDSASEYELELGEEFLREMGVPDIDELEHDLEPGSRLDGLPESEIEEESLREMGVPDISESEYEFELGEETARMSGVDIGAYIKDLLAHVLLDEDRMAEYCATESRMAEYCETQLHWHQIQAILQTICVFQDAQDERRLALIAWLADADHLTQTEFRNCICNLIVAQGARMARKKQAMRDIITTSPDSHLSEAIESHQAENDAFKDFVFIVFESQNSQRPSV